MNVRRVTGKALHRLPKGLKGIFPVKTRQRLRQRLGRGAWEMSVSEGPPELQLGEEVGSPQFIGIGVQKAGTTWWYDLIAAHPDAYRSTRELKELHYFSRFATTTFGPAEIAEYHRRFPRKGQGLTGEWTPDYFYLPWVPYLVSLAAPDARLIVCLRDPIERLRSGLAHSQLNFRRYASPTIADAMAQGFYSNLLNRWLGYFQREQLLALQFERNALEPGVQIGQTYEFLGVDAAYRPANLGIVVDKTPIAKVQLDDDTRRRLVDIYLPDVLQLKNIVPDIDLSLWPNFSEYA